MKLRNKKTGEIGNFCYGYTNELCVSWQKDDGFWAKQEYTSLAELNEEWEDYEEPKSGIEDIRLNDMILGRHIVEIDFTKVEEAEKAVEKLKAWKRLEDKGFEFVGCFKDNTINFEFVGHPLSYDEAEEAEKDLDLLFGGEE